MLTLRGAVFAVGLATVIGAFALTYHKGKQSGMAEVQAQFDEYKGGMEDQMRVAKEYAAKVKLEQEAKYEKAKSDYKRDTTILTERLRDYEGVLCGPEQNAVRLDERGGSIMPPKTNTPTP